MNAIARKGLLLAAGAAITLPATGCVNRLDPSDSNQLSPQISGQTIVWEDDRNDPPDGTDVYSYSTATATESLVAGGAGDQGEPAVSNGYFVWSDDGRLKAEDRSNGNVFSVTNGAADQGDPALCGSVVVWSDGSNNSDVYAKDLAGGPVIPVATSPAVEAYPACDAGRVVYMYAPIGQFSSIRLYDIASGQTREVSNQAWNDWRPAISGNRVVWQGWPNQPDTIAGIQIFGTNLDTGQDFVVTNGLDNQTAPQISGSTVVWEDIRTGQREVWWRDLATTMSERPVDGSRPGSQIAPSVYGGMVVFQADEAGPWNIFNSPLFANSN